MAKKKQSAKVKSLPVIAAPKDNESHDIKTYSITENAFKYLYQRSRALERTIGQRNLAVASLIVALVAITMIVLGG